ncbi:Vacuolar protein sorting-associated protein 20 [Friedmanniomyces endolithicus]|uniref:Vacuolar protein sorting-associated protein 20 n=1 Tax=Friedmanniomyces endolithicus TaxID=329885 RepID=A0AAN6QJV9_9PEZI|nr:Vacuolar protein sorting-associated protein 20 [Friedmanniomyces endolithicus]KAK0293279.1 Vacuolar protein sorting-associated protein 20 [Friedmanniomyces endolithicus]KAK0306902.1 Vacuolar protein sorting-associated protein 20 [Friedmanniomyces endolithicus]KAK0915229.1 Vacuolar protein sorting-associated protein 20 [Friedmanniomyces endolithicus]KAK0965932.1 Vacuolar protein sorting-associated protein 20 [Friedmanniomyces endolithicus]
MGNTNSSNKISAQDRAILDMKLQRDKLHQYALRIQTLTSRETEIARECLRQNQKSRALLALRRKKYQESLLAKTDQQLAQLEVLTSDVEFALVQKDVLFGLQRGTEVLREIHREMGGLERVEMILGESAEAREYQEEVSEMLGGKMSNQDEDEVEDELEVMQREVVGVRLPSAPSSGLEQAGEVKLPDVPQETPAQRAKRRRTERAREQAAEPPAA